MKTLLVKCPDCNEYIDLGTKNYKNYAKINFALALNVKCPDCDTLFDNTDINERDFKVIDIKEFL